MSSWNCFVCKEYKEGTACTFCDDGSKFKRMTNGDHVRNMTDEELAKVIGEDPHCQMTKCTFSNCYECTLKWLQAEVKEGE